MHNTFTTPLRKTSSISCSGYFKINHTIILFVCACNFRGLNVPWLHNLETKEENRFQWINWLCEHDQKCLHSYSYVHIDITYLFNAVTKTTDKTWLLKVTFILILGQVLKMKLVLAVHACVMVETVWLHLIRQVRIKLMLCRPQPASGASQC